MIRIKERFPEFRVWSLTLIIFLVGLQTILPIMGLQAGQGFNKMVQWLFFVGLILTILVWKEKVSNVVVPKVVFTLFSLWLLLISVSAVFGLDIANSFFGLSPRYNDSVLFFFSWTMFMFVLLMIQLQSLNRLIKFVTWLSFITALFGVLQYYGFAYYDGLEVNSRELIPSFLGNPNFSAMFVATTMPFMMWYAHKAESNKKRYGWYIAIAISLLSLLFFNSRAAILSTIMAIVVFSVLHLYKSRKLVVLAWLGLAVLFLISFSSFYNYTRVDIGGEEAGYAELSTSRRLAVWDHTVKQIIKNPVLGIGYGNYLIAYRDNDHPLLANWLRFDDPHNVILHQFVNTGVPAGLLFIGILFITFWQLLKAYWSDPDTSFAIPLIASFMAWLLASAFTPVPIPVWMLLGIIMVAAWRQSDFGTKQIDFRPKSRLILASVGLLLALFGVLAVISQLLVIGTQSLEATGEFQKVKTMSSIAKTLNPFNHRAAIAYVNAKIENGEYDTVRQDIENFTNRHPRSSGVYDTAAIFYIKLFDKLKLPEDRDAVFSNIQKMVDLSPNYKYTLLRSSIMRTFLKEYDQAVIDSNQALTMDDQDPLSWAIRAQLMYEMKDREEFIHALQKSNALRPRNRVKYLILKAQSGDMNLDPLNLPYQIGL